MFGNLPGADRQRSFFSEATMSDRWYYAHDDNKIGPFSDRQLMALAVLGEILRTDTIWKEGVEKGVLATKVQYLFPAAAPAVSQPGVSPLAAVAQAALAESDRGQSPATTMPLEPTVAVAPPAAELPDDIELLAEPKAPVAANRIALQRPAVKRRAVGIKGAVVVSQDGTSCKYRKKCTACGYEDTAWHTILITNGRMKCNFFCPKCRKRGEVEMQGSQH
jgi:GYF domain 2